VRVRVNLPRDQEGADGLRIGWIPFPEGAIEEESSEGAGPGAVPELDEEPGVGLDPNGVNAFAPEFREGGAEVGGSYVLGREALAEADVEVPGFDAEGEGAPGALPDGEVGGRHAGWDPGPFWGEARAEVGGHGWSCF